MRGSIVDIGKELDSRMESDELLQSLIQSVSAHIKEAIRCLEPNDISDLKRGKRDCLVICLNVSSREQVAMYERVLGYILENQDQNQDGLEYIYANKMDNALFLLIRRKPPKQPALISLVKPRERPCDMPGAVKGEGEGKKLLEEVKGRAINKNRSKWQEGEKTED